MGRRLLPILIAALAAGASPGADAQEIVLQILIGAPRDQRVEDVLFESASDALRLRSLVSSRLFSDATGTTSEAAADVDEEASRRNASYVLVTEYFIRGADVIVTYSLFTAEDEQAAATRELRSLISLELGDRAREAVLALLVEADVGRLQPEGADAIAPAPGTLREPDLAFAPRSRPVLDTSRIPLSLPEVERADAELSDAPDARRGSPANAGPVVLVPRSAVDIHLGTGGLVLTGASRLSFASALLVTAGGGYRRSNGRFSVLYEGALGYDLVFGGNAETSTSFSVVTVGAGVAAGTDEGALLSGAIRAEAGAAIVIVEVASDTLAKTVPYAEAGVTTRFRFAPRWAIELDTCFRVTFDAGLPIIGIAPVFRSSYQLPLSAETGLNRGDI